MKVRAIAQYESQGQFKKKIKNKRLRFHPYSKGKNKNGGNRQNQGSQVSVRQSMAPLRQQPKATPV